jgi:hypothetical protein
MDRIASSALSAGILPTKCSDLDIRGRMGENLTALSG